MVTGEHATCPAPPSRASAGRPHTPVLREARSPPGLLRGTCVPGKGHRGVFLSLSLCPPSSWCTRVSAALSCPCLGGPRAVHTFPTVFLPGGPPRVTDELIRPSEPQLWVTHTRWFTCASVYQSRCRGLLSPWLGEEGKTWRGVGYLPCRSIPTAAFLAKHLTCAPHHRAAIFPTRPQSPLSASLMDLPQPWVDRQREQWKEPRVSSQDVRAEPPWTNQLSALRMDSPPPGAPDLIHLGMWEVWSDSPPAPAHAWAVHFTLPGSALLVARTRLRGCVCLSLPGAAWAALPHT